MKMVVAHVCHAVSRFTTKTVTVVTLYPRVIARIGR